MEGEWILSIVIGIVLLIVILTLRRSLRQFLLRVRADVSDRPGIRTKMKQIEEMLEVESEFSWRQAVLESDKLLDYALKELMFPGQGLYDRLKLASAKFRRLRPVFRAHRLRNQIAHESDFRLPRHEAKRAVGLYRDALHELGVL